VRKFRYALVALLALSMLLAACKTKTAEPAQPSGSAQPAATFHYYLVDKPTTFDPAMVSDVSTMQVIQNVFSGLVMFNEKGEVVADMAAKWEISPDNKTYTFTLKDATFADGTKVTARDFVRSMVRAMNPVLASPVSDSYLDDIAGYHAFLAKRGDLDTQKGDKKITDDAYAKALTAAYTDLVKAPGIEAKDDKTLVITLTQPAAYFLAKMTYPTAWVVHPAVPNDKPMASAPENVKLAIGTGPFTLDSYVEGSKVVLKRNPKYYGYQAKVGTVELAVITQDAAQLAAYQGGQFDMAPIPTTDYQRVKADAVMGKEVLEYPTARVNYFALNQNLWAPARDVRVRQAFAYAIDKEKLNQVVYQGTQFPAYGILPPSIPGALGDKVQGLRYDGAKAKDLLKQAGYGEGGKPLTLKLTYRAKNETSQRLAEFIQSQLQTNLGIKVNLDPMEWSKLLDASDKKTELESFLLGWSADYIDPQDFLTILLHSDSPNNRYGYTNKDFDAILNKADHSATSDRMAQYSKAEQLAVTDAAWVPTTFGKSLFLVKPYIKGVRNNAMGILPLNTVTVNK
jgi:ABC-type oligopeptide transport system substrate-binding subunit